jgi:hypothetical protein
MAIGSDRWHGIASKTLQLVGLQYTKSIHVGG